MLYDYRCSVCGETRLDVVLPIARRETHAPECCGQKMGQIHLQAPAGYVDNMTEYRCPITGDGITSRRQRNESMKRLGVIDANDVVRTPEQRRRDTQKKREEIARIKAEEAKTVPKELRGHMEQTFKRDLKEFVNRH